MRFPPREPEYFIIKRERCTDPKCYKNEWGSSIYSAPQCNRCGPDGYEEVVINLTFGDLERVLGRDPDTIFQAGKSIQQAETDLFWQCIVSSPLSVRAYNVLKEHPTLVRQIMEATSSEAVLKEVLDVPYAGRKTATEILQVVELHKLTRYLANQRNGATPEIRAEPMPPALVGMVQLEIEEQYDDPSVGGVTGRLEQT